MLGKKILYLVTEIDPFLQLSSLAVITRKLVQSMSTSGYEVRVIMPRFSVINERINRIHEVQRLCGININIGEDNISLIVKVAPIKKAKIQVYFIDNEDLFDEKKVFHEPDGTLCRNNETRIAFICKAALVILEHLAWVPDIIHCIGWPWAFVPMYGKVAYKNFLLLKHTKFVYTYGPGFFREKLGTKIWQKANMRKVTREHLSPLGPQADFRGFVLLTKAYADHITYSFDEKETLALDILKKLDINFIPNDEKIIANYQKIYGDLLRKTKANTL